MRIVTFNINGLRACLRRRFNGKLIELLRFLEADIICLQETKLARSEADRDLALAEGWCAVHDAPDKEDRSMHAYSSPVSWGTIHTCLACVRISGPVHMGSLTRHAGVPERESGLRKA